MRKYTWSVLYSGISSNDIAPQLSRNREKSLRLQISGWFDLMQPMPMRPSLRWCSPDSDAARTALTPTGTVGAIQGK